jgi:IS5 family transposase
MRLSMSCVATWVLALTPGNTHDSVMAQPCVSLIPGISELLADKGYDSNAFRKFLKDQGIRPVIPGKSNRKKKIRQYAIPRPTLDENQSTALATSAKGAAAQLSATGMVSALGNEE